MMVSYLGMMSALLCSCASEPIKVSNPTPDVTPSVLASIETTRVKANGFSIVVPKSFKNAPWQGDDSSGWTFKSKDMTVDSESGIYAPDAKNYGYLNYHLDQRQIDGELVQIAEYEYPTPRELIDPSKNKCVVAYFPAVDERHSALHVSACFTDWNDRYLATQIIESIEFERV